ncbi:MAG: hypothetical protein C4320_06130 [Armatimonadota bacterium]
MMILSCLLKATWPAFMLVGPHHSYHAAILGPSVNSINREVLRSVDKVQAQAPRGGGYFTGVRAIPAESPIGFSLRLKGEELLRPPRSTSYCSGSTYAVLVETLNQLLPKTPSPQIIEELRMQEPDGSRREDEVKAWGWWNADGFGCDYALVQYLGLGTRVKLAEAIPGDFMNISWKSGNGHSVVFLGWIRHPSQPPAILVWSSQKGTNGYGDLMAPLSSIREISTVRLTDPLKLLTLQPGVVDRKAAVGESPERVTLPGDR